MAHTRDRVTRGSQSVIHFSSFKFALNSLSLIMEQFQTYMKQLEQELSKYTLFKQAEEKTGIPVRSYFGRYDDSTLISITRKRTW